MLVCHLLVEKRYMTALSTIIGNGVLPSTTATTRGDWSVTTATSTTTLRTTATPTTVQGRSQLFNNQFTN